MDCAAQPRRVAAASRSTSRCAPHFPTVTPSTGNHMFLVMPGALYHCQLVPQHIFCGALIESPGWSTVGAVLGICRRRSAGVSPADQLQIDSRRRVQSPPGVNAHGTSYSRVGSVPSRYLGAVSVASACKNNVHFTLRAAVSRRPSRRAPHALTSTAGWVNMGILPLHGRLAATRRKASFRHLADPK